VTLSNIRRDEILCSVLSYGLRSNICVGILTDTHRRNGMTIHGAAKRILLR